MSAAGAQALNAFLERGIEGSFSPIVLSYEEGPPAVNNPTPAFVGQLCVWSTLDGDKVLFVATSSDSWNYF